MTSLNRPRRRAENFAALVDATAATDDRGAYAAGVDRELVGLLQLVTTLRDHPRTSGLEELATPRPAHTDQLRERLMAEAATVLTPERVERHAVLSLPPRRTGARERRLATAATVLVVLAGSTGMAAAAERSLPGQALYPVKRGIERVDVALSTSTAGKGRDVLHQASTRLDEVTSLAEGPAEGVAQIPSTMQEFARQAKEGSELMFQAYQETSDPATIQAVQDFAQTEGNQVVELMAKPEVAPSLHLAATTLNTIQQATLTCDECPAISLDPILVSVSTDSGPVPMQAADGTQLGSGALPAELGTVPETGDSGSVVEATDGSGGTVQTLPGLPDDPASSSPLPPVDGVGGATGGDTGVTGGDTGVTVPDPVTTPTQPDPPEPAPTTEPVPQPSAPPSTPDPEPSAPVTTDPPAPDPSPSSEPSDGGPSGGDSSSPDPSATAADPSAADPATSAAPTDVVADGSGATTPDAASGDAAAEQPAS